MFNRVLDTPLYLKYFELLETQQAITCSKQTLEKRETNFEYFWIMFEVNNKNTRATSNWNRSTIFIVKFEHIQFINLQSEKKHLPLLVFISAWNHKQKETTKC